jgi:hypothetical protein
MMLPYRFQDLGGNLLRTAHAISISTSNVLIAKDDLSSRYASAD